MARRQLALALAFLAMCIARAAAEPRGGRGLLQTVASPNQAQNQPSGQQQGAGADGVVVINPPAEERGW